MIWGRKYVRQLTYVAVAVLFVNSIFHSMVYANWWRTDKLLIKPKFHRQYDSYNRCMDIDSLVQTTHENPKIVSNQRDLYYLSTDISYENVWFDDIVSNKSLNGVKETMLNYKQKGYTHLIYHAFSDTSRHNMLINVGSRYITDVGYMEDRDVRIYEIR